VNSSRTLGTRHLIFLSRVDDFPCCTIRSSGGAFDQLQAGSERDKGSRCADGPERAQPPANEKGG
jgi:hypothetical protein